MCEVATWIFSMSLHDGRHQLSGGLHFEELRVLAQHLVEHVLAQVGDGGDADVVDQVVAEVVGESL